MTHITIDIELPDDIAQRLKGKWENLPQRAVEALAAEGYRAGVLTALQVQQMLNLPSRWEADAFLQERRCYLDYNEEDLARDLAVIRGQGGR
ncbi:MAG: UPF0175 family protein [Candidatus Latescibacterota bacterium]